MTDKAEIKFEAKGSTLPCRCKACGWKVPITFFKADINITEDGGPCGECGEWQMVLDLDG